MKPSKPRRYQITEMLITASLLISLLPFSNSSTLALGPIDADNHHTQPSLAPSQTSSKIVPKVGSKQLLSEEIDQKNSTESLEGPIIHANIFRPNEMKKLSKEGITIEGNVGTNFFQLGQGNALFNPTSDITIGTDIAVIQLAANASVFVSSTENSLSIYSLHENAPGDVSVSWDNNTLEMKPGHMLALEAEKPNENGELTGQNDNSICYGTPEKVVGDAAMKAFLADHSIASAANAFIRLHSMLSAIEKQKQVTAVQILKSAGALQDIVRQAESLSPTPTEPVHTQ